jgi:hypothetical protein
MTLFHSHLELVHCEDCDFIRLVSIFGLLGAHSQRILDADDL